MTVSVTPSEFTAGSSASISISLKSGETPPAAAILLQDGKEVSQVTLARHTPETLLAGFTLLSPGHYSAKVGSSLTPFEVTPQAKVPFHYELGLLTLSVITILGGLILWQMKKRKG